jgi:hypothetical protein
LPAARIAGRHARLAWAVFCLQRAPPLQLGPELVDLFAQHGEQPVAFRDLRGEFRLERGFLCRIGFARQRWIQIRRVHAGWKEARGVGADPQMRVVARPALALMAQPRVVGVGHGGSSG